MCLVSDTDMTLKLVVTFKHTIFSTYYPCPCVCVSVVSHFDFCTYNIVSWISHCDKFSHSFCDVELGSFVQSKLLWR